MRQSRSSFFQRPWFWGLCVFFVGTFALVSLWPKAFPENPQEFASNAQLPIDQIVVEKSLRAMTLYSGNDIVKIYRISLGASPVGDKAQEGDERTPEGIYKITSHNSKSAFYKSLKISYPDETDRKEAAAQGLDPGGDIMIHGLPNGYGWVGAIHRWYDWTDGCIAVTNDEMDEVYTLVKDGTKITIIP